MKNWNEVMFCFDDFFFFLISVVQFYFCVNLYDSLFVEHAFGHCAKDFCINLWRSGTNVTEYAWGIC